ncbi:MAG TPA: helix-turn-helix transcriptional regulator [Anaerolineales bacterium]|nr:helix-turn-helix transcriptional regulator [Anaerolineales bacterium]
MDTQFLADQVFNQRRTLGISQGELAERAGISRNYVSLIERGEASNLSINVLNNLAAALGVTPAELTGEVQKAHTLIPPTLRDFALQAGLSFETVDRLARIPRRGAEPKTPDEWATLFEAVRAYLE